MSKQKKSHAAAPRRQSRFVIAALFGALLLMAVIGAWPMYQWWSNEAHDASPAAGSTPSTGSARDALGGKLRFTDAEKQAHEFLEYNSSIQLTSEQEAIKREALESMPAACCKDSSAYTCCCSCNLSKTIWGLSNYVISRHNASAPEVREVVTAWKDFTNPGGYSGSVCYTGGCERPFRQNGCGGMSESHLVL